MAFRCTEEQVRSLVDSDDDVRLQPFITTANVLTDDVSAEYTGSLISAATLIEIEKYLAAHFYEHRDQALASEKTGDASGDYQGEWGKGLNGSSWGQTAMLLDKTGYLKLLSKGRRVVSIGWGGLPPSEQTAVEDRD